MRFLQSTHQKTVEQKLSGNDAPKKDKSLSDLDIRRALYSKLRAIYAQDTGTVIIDELSMCQGEARVDLAVVNGSLSGYEIKSDKDNLGRLPHQLSIYNQCFEMMTVVVGGRHVAECLESLPQRWGIWEAIRSAGNVQIESKREPESNPEVESESVVQLLWRQEALESLQQIGITPKAKAGRRELWNDLVNAVPHSTLVKIVCDRIKARGDWRSGPTPFRDGGLSRSVATSRRSQANREWLLSTVCQRRLD